MATKVGTHRATRQLAPRNSYIASLFVPDPIPDSRLVGETEDEFIYELIPPHLAAQQNQQTEHHAG